jgi:hypothetical protein
MTTCRDIATCRPAVFSRGSGLNDTAQYGAGIEPCSRMMRDGPERRRHSNAEQFRERRRLQQQDWETKEHQRLEQVREIREEHHDSTAKTIKGQK